MNSFSYLTLITLMTSSPLILANNIAVATKKADDNQADNAPKGDDKKAEASRPAELKINLINDTGLNIYIRTKARVAESPLQYMEINGASNDETRTLATFQADPDSTFEIVDTDGAPGIFQVVVKDRGRIA